MKPSDDTLVTVAVMMPLALYGRILAMAAYDGCDFSGSVADSMDGDVEAWLESGSLAARKGNPNPRKFLRAFERELAAGLHPSVYPPCPVVTLDDHAAALLRERMAEYPDDDPRDVINGAVDFLLGEDGDAEQRIDDACGRRTDAQLEKEEA